jgi:glycosyltransferase involved in cell wall biosynthesis|tara:strand:- start:200 stop:310 length:111 start_codon:yes stop_codon:yes gene_type:complete
MKTKNSLVSIVMNCYNGEKYLKATIKSVLNQTYTNL